MTAGPSYLAVVPAYNEAATVGAVVRAIREHAPAFDVLVVDDGSTDATGRSRRTRARAVLQHPFNLGIGGAVQSGFFYALDHGYDYMVQVDGDGQHDPKEFAGCSTRCTRTRAWTWSAARASSADETYPAPISRRTGIHIFAFIFSRLVAQRVSDPTSGFRLYNRRAIALFARDYPHDYPEVEAVLMLHIHRLRMREIPVRMFQRGGGSSSISPGNRSTTWSRCCWRSSSAWPPPARSRSRRRGAGGGRPLDLMPTIQIVSIAAARCCC